MYRRTALWIVLALARFESASAQAAQDSAAQRTPAPLCYHARPKPACSGFLFTTFGGYLVLGSDPIDDTPLREVADWGVMANVGPRDAVGASVFASLDRLGFAVGPAVRYRRWLSSTESLDLAVGTPLVTSTENIQSGSVLGLVRWSPNHWFVVAARPELVRRPGCGPTSCNVAMHGRLSLGVEFGGVTGLVLTAAGGIATFLAALAALAGAD